MEMYSPTFNFAHVLAIMFLLVHLPYWFVTKD
ncbi:hypothetical protein EDD73_103140 [Heliophilum fasciatum]|uniref:Uncharacterized protein n=1 Tax=Heliophilum fasciatum TaxID=35700 RepID=A0A4V2SY38_9FIRM|nr:hypothetical protein [Heliophilum fasciatum]TCP68506.1 hypothetical protein EDD73_103140 [Heliophilum fasciatum]